MLFVNTVCISLILEMHERMKLGDFCHFVSFQPQLNVKSCKMQIQVKVDNSLPI